MVINQVIGLEYKDEFENPYLLSARSWKEHDNMRMSDKQLLCYIKRYIAKNKGHTYQYTYEDVLIITFAFAKFVTVELLNSHMNNEFKNQIFADAVERLKKKGYIKALLDKENNKAYMAMTQKGKEYYEKTIKTGIYPYALKNYNNAGHVYHDSITGQVFLEIIKMNIPYTYSRNLYTEWKNNKLLIIPDAQCILFPHSQKGNRRVLYIEADTGTETLQILTDKIGKYYVEMRNNNIEAGKVVFVYREKRERSIAQMFPLLFSSNGKYIKMVVKMLKEFKCSIAKLTDILECHQDCGLILKDQRDDENSQVRICDMVKVTQSIARILSIPYFGYLKENCSNNIEVVENLYKLVNSNDNRLIYELKLLLNIIETKKRINKLVKRIALKSFYAEPYMWTGLEAMLRGWDVLYLPIDMVGIYMDRYTPFKEKSINEAIKNNLSYYYAGSKIIENTNIEPDNEGVVKQYTIVNQKNEENVIYIEDITSSLAARLRTTRKLVIRKKNKEMKGHLICLIECMQDAIDLFETIGWEAKDYNQTDLENLDFSVSFILYNDVDKQKMFWIRKDGKKSYRIIYY